MFRVFYSNFGYFSGSEFETLEEAFAHARKTGFQSTIYKDFDTLVGSWCPLAGEKTFRQ